MASPPIDTVDANRMLDLPDDERNYKGAAAMLDQLGVASVRLMTNNPAKIEGLARHGVKVEARVPIIAETSGLAMLYLQTKGERMGHLLSPQEQRDHELQHS